MPKLKLNIGSSAILQDMHANSDTVPCHLYNGYAVKYGDDFTIYSNPGYAEFADTGKEGGIDGFYYSTIHDICLIVCEGSLYELDSDGTLTAISGASLTSGTPVIFTEDADSIAFAADSKINLFSPSSGTVTVLGANSPNNVTHVGYLAGYLVANGDQAGGTPVPGDVHFSNDKTNNYVTWEFFNNELSADSVESLLCTFNEIYAIGTETVEISYTTTDPNAPFLPNKGASQPIGTIAKRTLAYDQQSIYFLAKVAGAVRVVRLKGGRETQIISFPMDVPIESISDHSNAYAYICSFEGETFYVLTFPDTDFDIHGYYHTSITLAFSVKSETWSIWGEFQDSEYIQYNANNFVYIPSWDKRLIGASFSGKIYAIAGDETLYGDSIIKMSILTGWRTHGTYGTRKTCKSYTYDIKLGGDSDTTPQFTHRWRNNGEMEWYVGRVLPLGATGNRRGPLQNRQCGMYFSRQDELIFSDPVRIVLNSIEEDVE